VITLEQVRLLETKVTRTIDYVKKVTEENSLLKGKLDSCQKRIDELEVLVQQFKEDQNLIEDGILAALDELNQFDDAVANDASLASSGGKAAAPSAGKKPGPAKNPAPKPAVPLEPEEEEENEKPAQAGGVESGELDIF
jgi:hypothetical protein